MSTDMTYTYPDPRSPLCDNVNPDYRSDTVLCGHPWGHDGDHYGHVVHDGRPTTVCW